MTDVVTTTSDRIDHDRYEGDGEGAVVFVAGAGIWREIDPVTGPTALAVSERGVTALVHDRVGRGANRAEGRIGLERELDALEALVATVPGPTVLCGHSSGCTISLAAVDRGIAIDGLALWEAPIDPGESGTAQWVAELERLLDAGENEAAQLLYMRDMPPELVDHLRASPAWPDTVAQAESLRPDAESLAWAASGPHPEVFSRVRLPVRALYGSETFPEMHAAARSIASAIPGAVAGELPGAMHTWEPEPMADALVELVAACRPHP